MAVNNPYARAGRQLIPRCRSPLTYRSIFKDLGAAEVDVMDFDTRRDGDEPSRVASIKACDGVFLTGGNQMRLATTIGGTLVAKALREFWQ